MFGGAPTTHEVCCVTMYCLNRLKPVQTWLPGFAARCHYTTLGIASEWGANYEFEDHISSFSIHLLSIVDCSPFVNGNRILGCASFFCIERKVANMAGVAARAQPCKKMKRTRNSSPRLEA